MEPLFVVAKIIGSTGKNYSLLFNPFKIVLSVIMSITNCCVWQRTNAFVT